ncbi:MAG: hypothetical protein LKF71_00135 [Oscillospiraceae bacterium]|jgi:DNA-directed RNA polymerase subunit RPC12/RpoP|nr:hypothetical protein [Oscillospiraceae bacterium]
MKKTRYPKCPYCGKKLNPLLAFRLKSEGEYRCTKCSGISNIELNPAIYKLAVSMVLASAVIFLLEELLVRRFTWYMPLFLLVPFLIFYILCPRFLELKRPVIRRKKMERRVPNSVTGGVPYGPPHMDDPTVYVPSPYGKAIIQPERPEEQDEAANEPTIQVDSISHSGAMPGVLRPVPPQSLEPKQAPAAGHYALKRSLEQLEEDIGENAQPVFYGRPQREKPQATYHNYRAPLDDSRGGRNA